MTFVLNWPQITWMILASISLGMELCRHGQPKTGTYHFGYSLFSLALMFLILAYGGFFSGHGP